MSSPTRTSTPTETTSTALYTITDQKFISALNLGPITSLLSLPASCTQTLTIDDTGKPYFGRHSDKYYDSECYPTSTVSSRETPLFSGTTSYYSPAICPVGWTVAKKFESETWGDVPASKITLGPGTSAALCCPGGYTYGGWGRRCASDISQGQTVTFIRPSDIGVHTERGNVITSTLPKTDARGDGIPIWWQASDEKVLSAALSTTFAPTPSISAPTSGASSKGSSEQLNNSKSLSTGAKVGIGLGASIGVAALVLSLILFYLKQKRKRGQVNRGQMYEADSRYSQHHIYAYQQPVHEMSHSEIHHIAHELPGSTDGRTGQASELGNGRIKH